jgi:hypothetical protein
MRSFAMTRRQLIEAPLWAIVIDYILGMVMWTLIGRFGMRLFLPEDSNFFFMPLLRAGDESAAQGCSIRSRPRSCSPLGAAVRGVVLLHDRAST